MTNVFFITVLQQFKRNAYDLFVQIIYYDGKIQMIY